MQDDQHVPPSPCSNVSSHTAVRYLRFNEARTIAVNLADRLTRKRQRLVLLHLDLIAPLPRGALHAIHGALAPSNGSQCGV